MFSASNYVDLEPEERVVYVHTVAWRLMDQQQLTFDQIHAAGIDPMALRNAAPHCDDLEALCWDVETYFLI